jgi:hypothetical protein
MNGLDHRMKRVEEAAHNAGGKRVAYCWIEPDEDEDAALAKWKEENGGEDPDLEVFIVRWATERTMPPHKPEPGVATMLPGAALSIDDEIEKLYSELEQAGFTREQVSAMVKGEMAIPSETKVEERPVIPEPEKAPQPEEAKPAHEEPTMKAEDLCKLFAVRRR